MGAILALNAGSSSLKFALFHTGGDGDDLALEMRGVLTGADGAMPAMRASDAAGRTIADAPMRVDDGQSPVHALLAWIERQLDGIELTAVGHRVVHGGRRFSAPVRIDADVIAALDALTPLAPLHQPGSLAPIREFAAIRPDLLQVACFDTAFHHRLEPPVSRYPLTRAIEAAGVRRYGFHGLSYEAIAGKLAAEGPDAARRKIIVAHLGSGCSLCALRDLQSADTSMGFTALDGIMMGTRPGTLDPGILLYLQREQGYDLDRLEALLYHESGLKGVSGIASDIKVLLEDGGPEACEAIDLFTFSVARQVCALAATIGGIDSLVFTGGIGEHAWQIRAAIAARLEWLGAKLDADANREGRTLVSRPESAIALRMIPTDEEAVIARHTVTLGIA